MPNNNKSKKRILIISPGIEDNGMRGLGVVTAALIDGLSYTNSEILLLTGAPIKKLRSKFTSTSKSASRRFLDHYLLDGYKSKAFNLDIKKVFKLVASDALKLLFGEIEILQSSRIINLRHEPSVLRRFPKLSYFVNFAFIYKLSQRIPLRFRSLLIFRIAKLSKVDIIITASPYALVKNNFGYGRKVQVIQYVHDVMPLNVLETPPDLIDKFTVELENAIANADKVLVSSYNAKQKLEVLFPNLATTVVYLPCKPVPYGLVNLIRYSRNTIKKNDYYLFMSAVEERKNVARLIKAFALNADKIKQTLVIVGSKGYGWEEIEKTLNELSKKIREKIILTGYIPEEEKWNLIDNCMAVVHPAIDEGLGIPVIEGIIAAKPVVATRLNSIEEISPPNCVTFIDNPYDIYEIADKLKQVTNNKLVDHRAIEVGSKILSERFSIENFSIRLKKILNN